MISNIGIMSSIERLFENVSPEPNSGCWLWLGGANRDGYGHFKKEHGSRLNKKMMTAHRAAIVLTRGDIPSSAYVLHKCDVRLCCNPEHLEIGNQHKNMNDAMVRSRLRPCIGEKNGRAKISAAIVEEIRSTGVLTKQFRETIRSKWGISASQAYRIKRQECWK